MLCVLFLETDSSTSSVRVFSCGHATHVHCDFGNGALGEDFNAGCPLCTPRKNKSTNEKVLQNGLIESNVSRDWSANTKKCATYMNLIWVRRHMGFIKCLGLVIFILLLYVIYLNSTLFVVEKKIM